MEDNPSKSLQEIHGSKDRKGGSKSAHRYRRQESKSRRGNGPEDRQSKSVRGFKESLESKEQDLEQLAVLMKKREHEIRGLKERMARVERSRSTRGDGRRKDRTLERKGGTQDLRRRRGECPR